MRLMCGIICLEGIPSLRHWKSLRNPVLHPTPPFVGYMSLDVLPMSSIRNFKMERRSLNGSREQDVACIWGIRLTILQLSRES